MEYASLIAIGIYIIVFVAIMIIIPSAIIFNFKIGRKYREKLAQRLNSLRIHKMLAALGIDSAEYLHKEQVHEINSHLSRCASCDNTEKCDEELEAGKVEVGNISYCNNEESLQKILTEKERGN